MDMIIHLAALNAATSTFYTHPWEVLDVGVRGAMNVVQAAVYNKVTHLIMVSSSEVAQEGVHRETSPLIIPDPANPRFSYAASKIITEVAALTHPGLRHVQVIRPFNIYGPGQGLGHVIPDMIARKATLKDGDTVPLMGAHEVRSFCHVSDFVDGFMLAMKDGTSGVWNIGNDKPIRIDKLAEMIYSRAPARSTIDSIAVPGRPGAPTTRIPDITKLRALGYEPKIALEQGLAELLAQS
jgi:UDP-glucose 4-epimerase